MLFGLCVAVGAMGGCGADKPEAGQENTVEASKTEETGEGTSEAEDSESSEESVKEEGNAEFYLAKSSRYQSWNNENGEGTWRETKEYDADGNLTGEKYISEDAFGCYGYDTQYNADGNPVRREDYGNPDAEKGTESVMTGWCDYEYDARGNLSRELSYSTCEVTYDDDFNPVYTFHEDGFPTGLWEYDSHGNTLKRISYDEKGQASERIENTYDEKGNQTTCAVYKHQIYDEAQDSLVYNEEGMLDFREEMEYDAAGNSVKTTRYDKDGEIIYVIEQEYDAGNHLLSETSTYAEDGIAEKTEYTYDPDGNCVSEKYSYGGRMEYEYDANKNQIKSTYYNENGEGSVQFEAEYDANGNEIKRIFYDLDYEGNTIPIETTSKYDDSGNLLESKRTGGLDESWYRYEYDAKGIIIKTTELDQEGNVLSESSFEYNEKAYRQSM